VSVPEVCRYLFGAPPTCKHARLQTLLAPRLVRFLILQRQDSVRLLLVGQKYIHLAVRIIMEQPLLLLQESLLFRRLLRYSYRPIRT
jgi:hypothetical protein